MKEFQSSEARVLYIGRDRKGRLNMKVAIVGSRDYPDKQQVVDYVNNLPEDTIVVSGGAIGVDTWAEEAARERGLPEPIIFPADWKRYGKSAGFRRNYDIAKEADRVVAFTIGSNGTADTINHARKLGKDLEIYLPTKKRD
jgi:hypothetical protein